MAHFFFGKHRLHRFLYKSLTSSGEWGWIMGPTKITGAGSRLNVHNKVKTCMIIYEVSNVTNLKNGTINHLPVIDISLFQ